MKSNTAKAGPRTAKRLLSTGQVAKKLGVTQATVRGMVATRQIGYYRIGKNLKFQPADVKNFLATAYVPIKPPLKIRLKK